MHPETQGFERCKKEANCENDTWGLSVGIKKEVCLCLLGAKRDLSTRHRGGVHCGEHGFRRLIALDCGVFVSLMERHGAGEP
jgi:hypothetical protein